MSSCHIVIPDPQIKPNKDLDFMRWIGNYIVTKKPDSVVCLGDFGDMPSLSDYDKGKKAFEGRRYKNDVLAVHRGLETLMGPLHRYNKERRKMRKARYLPDLYMLGGNHDEGRINRAVECDPKLDGTIGIEDLRYEEYGWTYVPFLKPLVLDGVVYSHYFPGGVMGRPITSAASLLRKKHMSCIAGHQQGYQSSTEYRADGKRITTIIAGSSYPWTEDYIDEQSNVHWRGIIILHEVSDGEFTHVPVSLEFLKRKYSARKCYGL